jgi:hypothetical protein
MGVRTQKQIKHKDRLALFDLKIKSEVTDLLRTLSADRSFRIIEYFELSALSLARPPKPLDLRSLLTAEALAQAGSPTGASA